MLSKIGFNKQDSVVFKVAEGMSKKSIFLHLETSVYKIFM